jgi:hypothetical protein
MYRYLQMLKNNSPKMSKRSICDQIACSGAAWNDHNRIETKVGMITTR